MYTKISVPLFQINRETHLATPVIDPTAMWVQQNVSRLTKIDIDGRFVRILNGGFYFLYDWKPRTSAIRAKRHEGEDWHTIEFESSDCDPLPDSAFPCQLLEPVNGFNPYWYPAYHLHGYEYLTQAILSVSNLRDSFDGTYELVGPKIQGNPYDLVAHYLIPYYVKQDIPLPEINFDAIKAWFTLNYEEGITWHRADGSIARVKRKDFGFSWPSPQAKWSEEKLLALKA